MSRKYTIRQIAKALYFTFEPVKCKECHQRKPAFDFPIIDWHGVSYCRKCTNKILDGLDFHESFRPFKEMADHFRYALEWIRKGYSDDFVFWVKKMGNGKEGY
ncbi:MAG: hypothetical protein KIS29_11195 [Thermoplasmata archaeon]|nr:hypothetical protein [Candidatus Sysuiplasma jiujiangense]